MDNANLEQTMEELRRKIQAIEWDMKIGTFSKEKIPYYKSLLNEFNELKKKKDNILIKEYEEDTYKNKEEIWIKHTS